MVLFRCLSLCLVATAMFLHVACGDAAGPGKMAVTVDFERCVCDRQRVEVFLLGESAAEEKLCWVKREIWQTERSPVLEGVVPEKGESYSAAVAVYCGQSSAELVGEDPYWCCDQISQCLGQGTNLACQLSQECQLLINEGSTNDGLRLSEDMQGYYDRYCGAQQSAACMACLAVQPVTVGDGEGVTLMPDAGEVSRCDPLDLSSLLRVTACDP